MITLDAFSKQMLKVVEKHKSYKWLEETLASFIRCHMDRRSLWEDPLRLLARLLRRHVTIWKRPQKVSATHVHRIKGTGIFASQRSRSHCFDHSSCRTLQFIMVGETKSRSKRHERASF